MPGVFRIVLETSISAGIAALMVIAARLIIGRKPGIMLRLLFILLMVRLAVPIPIQSPLSVRNLFDVPVSQAAQVLDAPVYIPAEDKGVTEPLQPVEPQAGGSGIQETNTADDVYLSGANAAPAMSLMDICVAVWLSGIAVLSIAMISGNVRFGRYLKKNRAYDAPGFGALLCSCKDELGLKGRVETVRVSAINTAAVYGVFKPKLLISPTFEGLSAIEQRHVLLHELSHIKRRDNLFCLAASVLSVAYWFNPLIWAAFALMRRDIEVICDAEALEKIGDRYAYAQTLLRLAQSARAGKPRLVPALFISTDAIKRRMKMIASNKKDSVMITAIGMILIAAIAVCGCTTAVLPSQTPSETSAQITPAASGVNTFTLKDGSISVTIPEGWEAKESGGGGILLGKISNRDGENSIDIQSDDIGSDSTPDTIMENTGFYIAYDEKGKAGPQVEQLCYNSIASTPLTVDGVDGKLFEISADVKYNNSEMRGYIAVLAGNGKSYTIFYLSDPEDFEAYKDIVKSVILSAKFNTAKETAFTLKDGSVSVTVPAGWHANDISTGVTYSLGKLVSGDEKNEIKIECKRILGENVTPDSAMGQTMIIYTYTTADEPAITYTRGEEGLTSESVKTTITYNAEDGSGTIHTVGDEGVIPESAVEQTKVTLNLGDGTSFVTLNVSNGSGEKLTVNGTEGKLYSLKGGDQQGYMAIFVANGKVYTISYIAGSEDFENNKDVVKSVIFSAEFN